MYEYGVCYDVRKHGIITTGGDIVSLILHDPKTNSISYSTQYDSQPNLQINTNIHTSPTKTPSPMDNTDPTDDVIQLNYLRDPNGSFLLQSNDGPLGVQDPELNSETIFAEFGAAVPNAWNIDGLPVLMQEDDIADDQETETKIELQMGHTMLEQNGEPPTLSAETMDQEQYPIEVPLNEGFLTANNLFLSNDLFSQFTGDNNKMQILVGDNNQVYGIKIDRKDVTAVASTSQTTSTTQTKIITENGLLNQSDVSGDGEVIQLLNTDGSIININKNLLTGNKMKKTDTMGTTTTTVVKDEHIDLNEHVETVMAYKCKNCEYLSESPTEMSQHITKRLCNQSKSTPTPVKTKLKSILNVNKPNPQQQVILLCSECKKGYSSTEELKQHMITAHELTGPNGKEANGDQARHKQDCIVIVKGQHKAQRRIKCSVKGCDSRFAQDEFRIRHEECHVEGNKKQYRCPTCDKRFPLWRVCSMHMWKCHAIDVGLMSCVSCPYKAFSASKLFAHLLVHSNEKQFLCNVCGKKFKQMTQLTNHQALHCKQGEGAPNWCLNKKCEHCGNVFANAKCLKKHIQAVHNKFKPYVCNICGHKTSRKAMLELHLRQHTGEKPYSCHICEYRTGDHNCLRRHLMRHDGTKKYSCAYCDYQSIQSIAYKHHLLTKHPGKGALYNCKYCSFHSINKNMLESHQRLHHANNQKAESNNVDSNNTTASSILTTESEDNKKIPEKGRKNDDEETQHGFLSSLHTDETVDTGGITIPAGLELEQV